MTLADIMERIIRDDDFDRYGAILRHEEGGGPDTVKHRTVGYGDEPCERNKPRVHIEKLPKLYTLVVTKETHTSFTVKKIVVGDTDLDLTKDSREAVRCITLLCGDINGDNIINSADVAVLWQASNYNKSAALAANKLCELDGDGMVNNVDLSILWQAGNYNKGAVVVE
ncbi:MAG: dockerin type I repeat-containing protein [Oscillospiraceae bacterium]|jgi:hypothetical protein|nr:dockerin type I repeat-containing protein [Oscillospiraceae bacterium]